jgi:hypothetical protein
VAIIRGIRAFAAKKESLPPAPTSSANPFIPKNPRYPWLKGSPVPSVPLNSKKGDRLITAPTRTADFSPEITGVVVFLLVMPDFYNGLCPQFHENVKSP